MSQTAAEISSWVESAMYDMAGGDGIKADELYNDAEVLADTIGDQVYSAAKGDKQKRLQLIADLRNCKNFLAWNIAMDTCQEAAM